MLFGFAFPETSLAQLQGGAGNVRVNIEWNGDVDLDLYVTDPCGNTLGYARDSSAACRGFTGAWDYDDQGLGYRADNPNAENIVWPNGAPAGRYEVGLHYFAGTTPTSYTVRIFLGDREQPASIHRGSIGPANHGSPVRVTTFEADESVNFPVISIRPGPTVEEGETARFTLTASPPPPSSLTVTVAVGQNGDFAAAGQSGNQLVTIGTGGTGTLSVVTEDDAIGEPGGRITAEIVAAEGEDYRLAEARNAASVAVTDNDGAPDEPVADREPDEIDDVGVIELRAVEETLQAVTAGSLSNVTTNIGARFSAARGGGAALTLAGEPVVAGTARDALAAFEQNPKSSVRTPVAGDTSWSRGVDADDLLHTSAFELSLNAAEDGSVGLGLSHWTLWGRGDFLVFDNDPSAGAGYDGDLRAGYLGLDAWVNGQWLVGVAASRTQVDADYRLDGGGGRLDVTLTGVHPYVRYAPDERRELWAVLGAGTGEVTNARSGAARHEHADVEMFMAAAGARQALEPLADGVAVALLGDAGFGRLDGDSGTGLQTLGNLAVDTWRARAGAELSYPMMRANGTSITPFAEFTGRIDGGGEDDTRAGVEVSAGAAYADPASGFGLEARGRTLVLYSGGDYQEYGASLTASLSPGAGGEGLSLALSPRLGFDPGTTDVLWREHPFRALDGDRREHGALSLDAEIGYGVSVPSVRGLITPFGTFRTWNGDDTRARAGVRFGMPGSAHGVHLELAGARHEAGAATPEHRLEVIGGMRF